MRPMFRGNRHYARPRTRRILSPDELKGRAEAKRTIWAEGELQHLANTNRVLKLQILSKLCLRH